MFKKIKEGDAEIYVPSDKKISKELPVFYNKVMEYNRTITIDVINALNKEVIYGLLPLGGTGVRAIRLFKESDNKINMDITVNDYDKKAVDIIKKNIILNYPDTEEKKKGYFLTKNGTIRLTNREANRLISESKGFDYIDIDPLGSPNNFLNNSISHLKIDGLLAVTATDTGALCGTYRKACLRKYWAEPLHNEEMHEIGLRILIRKVQLIGMQFDKALIPVLSYDKDHYMRVFFICKKGREKCFEIFNKHQMYKEAGPLWTGNLKDVKIAEKIKEHDSFTKRLKEEIDILGFYDIPTICKREKVKSQKKIEQIIESIINKGFNATRTQFSGQGVKSDIGYKEIVKILKVN